MILILVAFATQLLTSLLFLLGTYGASRALGVPVERVQLGTGPAALKRRVGSVTLALGVLPLGSYVQFVRDEPAPEDTPESAGEDAPPPPPDAFERASRLARLGITFAGLAMMAALPLVVLGPGEAVASIGRGVPQLVSGTLAPLSTGRALVAAAAELPAWTLMGVLASKVIAWNLLPIPSTTLWTFLRVLLGGGWSRSCVASFVPMLFGVAWLVAIGAWLFGSP